MIFYLWFSFHILFFSTLLIFFYSYQFSGNSFQHILKFYHYNFQFYISNFVPDEVHIFLCILEYILRLTITILKSRSSSFIISVISRYILNDWYSLWVTFPCLFAWNFWLNNDLWKCNLLSVVYHSISLKSDDLCPDT